MAEAKPERYGSTTQRVSGATSRPAPNASLHVYLVAIAALAGFIVMLALSTAAASVPVARPAVEKLGVATSSISGIATPRDRAGINVRTGPGPQDVVEVDWQKKTSVALVLDTAIMQTATCAKKLCMLKYSPAGTGMEMDYKWPDTPAVKKVVQGSQTRLYHPMVIGLTHLNWLYTPTDIRVTVVGQRSGPSGHIVADEIHVEPLGTPGADGTAKPRYLCIGDSVSDQYMPRLQEMLADRFTVRHPPVNCAGTDEAVKVSNGILKIKSWLGPYEEPAHRWDVISFNFGEVSHRTPFATGTAVPCTSRTDFLQVSEKMSVDHSGISSTPCPKQNTSRT